MTDAPTAARESNPLLLRHLAEIQAPVVTFQEVPRSLEQVYLKVMADVQMPTDVRPVVAPAMVQQVSK